MGVYFNQAISYMSFVFEWTSKPLKSIFCILVTHPITEATFIIQAMNQWAASSSFRAGYYSSFVKKRKIIETHSLSSFTYKVFSFLLLQTITGGYFCKHGKVNLIWLHGRCKKNQKNKQLWGLLGAMLQCCFWSWTPEKMTYFSDTQLGPVRGDSLSCHRRGAEECPLVVSMTGMAKALTL